MSKERFLSDGASREGASAAFSAPNILGAMFGGQGDMSHRAVIDQIPDGLYVKDRAHRFVFANHAAAVLNAFSDPKDMIGICDHDMFPQSVADAFRAVEAGVMETGIAVMGLEERLDNMPSGTRWILTSKVPFYDQDGEIIGLIGISRDITERKREEALRSGQSNLLEMIATSQPLPDILAALVLLVEDQLEGIRGSILLIEPDGVHVRHGAAPSLPEQYNAGITGVAIGPRVGSCGTAAWHRTSVFVSDIATDIRWEGPFRDFALGFSLRSCWSTPIMAPENELLGTFALYSQTVRMPTDEEIRMIGMATHIAGIAIERSKAEERIHFFANHDPLTGLLNRSHFEDKVAHALMQAHLNGMRVTMVFVDLDDFKGINDGLGHAVGDEVLCQLSARMRAFARASDLVVRLGGDEFVLVLSHRSENAADILPRLGELHGLMRQPMALKSGELRVTCSIGVSFYPEDGTTVGELLAKADAAMYAAKTAGRDTLRACPDQPN